jgi:hypothetical protein
MVPVMPAVLRCPHCFDEYVELSLKIKRAESQEEAMMIRTRKKVS